MPMHAWSGKGASRLTGTTMVTAPGLQLRKWTPGSALEYLWCPLAIRVIATLLDSVTLDHSTTMTRLICTIIKFSVRLFSNLYIYLSPARYLSERHRQDSSQAQPTTVHICWSPPLSVTRWHCIEYPWWHCAVSSRYPWWHGHYYYSLMSCPVTLQTRGEHSSSPRMWSVSVQPDLRRSWGEYPLSESWELQLQPICLNSEHSSHLNVKVLNV